MQEGDFEMIHVDRVGSRAFNVAIAPFSLSLLGDDDVHTVWDRTATSPSKIVPNKHAELVVGCYRIRCSHSHIEELK